MRRVEVEARDDADHVDGGYVVISLQGLDHLDDGISFFLRPLDAIEAEGGEGLGLLEHELRASAVRNAPGGVELVVGPEITEHPALQPGSSVEIEIAEAGVWSEFSWPQVTVRARPKRAKIVVNRPPVGAPAVPEPVVNGAMSPGPIITPARDLPAAERGMPRPAVATGRDVDNSARSRPTSQTQGPGSNRVDAEPGPSPTGKRMAAERANDQFLHEDTTSMVSEPAEDRAAPGAAAAVPGHQEDGHTEAQEYVVFYPYARGGKLGTPGGSSSRRATSLLPTSRLGAAATAVAALLAVQGLVWLGSGGRGGTTAATPAMASADQPSLYDLFAVGPVSPRGVQASDIKATKALENAQAALLTPGATRDAEEASYWLRRCVTLGGSDERTRRVLTQLGTTFADATNQQPEFAKARQVWELASAFGDPVAMCFLGTLYENGLGVASDRKTALDWFERAKATGGCPAVDEAIARVKK